MSFYDDASLVFLPSGGAGKDTKAYSIKPTDGSGDFTFSRGSNLTATRIDSNGLIAKGRENLLVNSVWDGVTTNTKPTGWTTQLVSGTGTFDVTATEGQIRFQTLDASSRSFIYSPTITTNGIVVASVYVDEVTTAMPLIQLLSRSGNATDLFAYEDGVEINYSDNVQAGKRYSVVFNKTASTNFRFGVGVSSGTLGDVVLSRPQIEVGLVATEWITSPVGSKGLAGILEDSPRFDYSGGASCPSLLLEPSRTNLLNQSEYFEDFKLGSVTLTTNAITSPEGVQNASLVVCPSGRLGQNVSLTNGTDYVVSVFAKQKGNTFNMRAADGTNPSVEFNLATQTTTDTNGAVGSIEDYGNGWYRCIMKFTASATGSFEIRYVLITDENGVYAYGAQMEEGSYPTSYIPNHSGGSVTRDEDVCTNSTGGVSQTEGTIFIDYKDSPNKDVLFACSTSSGLITNNIRLSYNQLYIRNSTGNLVVASVTLPDEGKLAIKYDTNGVEIFSNGSSIYTNSTRISFDGSVDFVRVGSRVNNLQIEEFNVNQFLIFTTALSDNNCITLTS